MLDLREHQAARAFGPAIRGITYNGSAGLIARRVGAVTEGNAPPSSQVLSLSEGEELATAMREYAWRDGHWPAAVDTPGGERWLLGADPAVPGADAQAASRPTVPLRDAVVRGRVVLITGAAQGFGWALAKGLAREGAWIVVADRNVDGARARARELDQLSAAARGDDASGEAAPARHLALGVDVSDEASVSAMVGAITDHYGGLDLVVSNAGVVRSAGVTELSADDFAFVTRVNYTGFFLVTKHCAPVLAAQDESWRSYRAAVAIGGATAGAASALPPAASAPAQDNGPDSADLSRYFTDIVEINSKSGLVGSNRNAAYAGSKFGGIGLVQSFALELVESGIKVNALCPGNFLDGPLWSDPETGLFVQYLRAGKVPGAKTVADVRAAYEARVPMGRGCTGADVLRALLYTVEQRYETGQAVPVTGGQVMLS